MRLEDATLPCIEAVDNPVHTKRQLGENTAGE